MGAPETKGQPKDKGLVSFGEIMGCIITVRCELAGCTYRIIVGMST